MKKIAILGAGTVGGSCAQILLRDAAVLEKNAGEALELAYVVDLRDMPDAPFHDKMVKDFAVVEADPEVFLVIEAIGGCGAALNFVRRSLEAGKHVVTSNKQLVAEHGTQLLALAKAHGVSFLFEASVGGGIPVLHPLSQCLGANEILEVRGILNGTTNFILTQMLEFGQSYDAALKDAQARGYAEQNPAADVDGIDAGRKICILADMMFGKNVDPARVSMTGISTITAEDAAFAESAGMKLKLLGRAIRQGEQIAVFVSPHFVAGAQPLAPVSGVLNAIEVLGNNIGNAMFFGPGAGGPATASAVLGDVVDIVRNPGRKQPVDWSAEPADLTDPDAFEASFFLRTKLDKAACEQALGEIRWLPDQNGFHGGFTGKTCWTRSGRCWNKFGSESVLPCHTSMTGGIFYETQMGTRVHAGRAGRGGAAFSVQRVAESAHGGPRAGQRERMGAPEAAVLAVPRGRVRARARRGRRKRPLVRAAGGAAGRALAAAWGVLSAPVRLRRARALARSAFVRAGDGRGVFARIPAAAQSAAGVAVRASCDRGRGLWGGAGAVFLCAAGSAYFPPVGAKKSAVCC